MIDPHRPDSVFGRIGEPDLVEYLAACRRFRAFDVEEARRVALASIRYYKGDHARRDELVAGMRLERRWYASLRDGTPDYSVYEDDSYLSDLWACWIVYSRKYLLALGSPRALPGDRSVVRDLGEVRGVADLGCGFGYTTAALKELFPAADVFGTNLDGTLQSRVAAEIGAARSFRVVADIEQVGGPVDLVFASEYFEHIRAPIEHLVEILRAARPKALIVANSFGARSTGHFDAYEHGARSVPNTLIGRAFNAALRDRGYRKVETSWWNGRPAYWKLAAATS